MFKFIFKPSLNYVDVVALFILISLWGSSTLLGVGIASALLVISVVGEVFLKERIMIVELLYYPPPYGRSISLGLFEVDKESDADDLCDLYSKEYIQEVFWTEVE